MLYYEEEGSAFYGPPDPYFDPQQNLHDAHLYALIGLKSVSI